MIYRILRAREAFPFLSFEVATDLLDWSLLFAPLLQASVRQGASALIEAFFLRILRQALREFVVVPAPAAVQRQGP